MANNESNSDNIKNALCYIPIVAIILYFIEWKKSDKLIKHIRYWIVFFIAYLILTIFLSWLLSWIIYLLYTWCSIVFWYKAYIWEDISISFIDDFFKSKK